MNEVVFAQATPATSAPVPLWLAQQQPLDLYTGVVSLVLVIIAVAQWLASYYTDPRALRLFALYNASSALGWLVAAPHRHGGPADAPFIPMVAAVVLLAINVWALDEFFSWSTPRRRALIAAVAVVTILALRLWVNLFPGNSDAIFAVMAASMTLCAAMAWSAARDEGNVGHRVVALAFLSYPLLVIGVALSGVAPGRTGISYLIALPNVLAGVTMLVVSLIRAGRRIDAALQEQRRAEQALRELNATLEHRVGERTAQLQVLVDGLESFTRHVSHDLRGPLAGLSGVARIAEEALEQGDAARAARMMSLIVPQAEQLQALVQGLLALSRVQGAACERVRQPLSPLAQAALTQLALVPETAQYLARVSVIVDELGAASVDSAMLKQVFVNLLGNAVRFAAAHGPGEVRVGVRGAGEDAAYFVRDSGPGFSAEQSTRLFEPFSKLHGAGLSRSGIGLSLVRRAIERHGGRVWAESAPGAGATFWFSLGPMR